MEAVGEIVGWFIVVASPAFLAWIAYRGYTKNSDVPELEHVWMTIAGLLVLAWLLSLLFPDINLGQLGVGSVDVPLLATVSLTAGT